MTPVTQSKELRPTIVPLEADGPSSLRSLRNALREVLAAVPSAARAVDLGLVLKIDRSLAWKVWRVAQGPDELPSPKHVPGKAAMAAFLRAALAHGAPAEVVARARESHARLERVFKQHAGDRASAEIMLGQFTDEGRSRLEMQLRRESYRANSHFLGVRMRMRHQLDVLLPSPEGFMPRLARVRGYYGLQRIRAGARWVLSRGFVLHDAGPTGDYRRAPLTTDVRSGDNAEVPIVPGFCTPVDLPLRRERGPGHSFVDELGPSPIGEAGAANIVTGELISEVPRRAVTEDVLGVHVRTPTERLCYEVLVHREMLREPGLRLDVYTTLNAPVAQAAPDPRDRVPVMERLENLGSAARARPLVHVPRHAELTAWVFERLGYAPADFCVFRFSMRFPPIAIVLRVTYPIPG